MPFHRPTDVTTSFSEMLLLLAIHVHSGQLTAISDLVCSTLGMRVSIRNHNMSRVKVIFMQEVFTEQVSLVMTRQFFCTLGSVVTIVFFSGCHLQSCKCLSDSEFECQHARISANTLYSSINEK